MYILKKIFINPYLHMNADSVGFGSKQVNSVKQLKTNRREEQISFLFPFFHCLHDMQIYLVIS